MAATHLALEFTDGEVRVAVASVTKGTATLVDLFDVALPEAKDDSGAPLVAPAAAALRQALRTRRLRPQHATVVLPKLQVTTRRVYLPSNDIDEIARMARFEAERHVPFHPERHIISHHVVRNEGIEGAQVFLAAVDEPVVGHAVAVLSAADVPVHRVTLNAATAHAALLLAEPDTLRERVVALVDIGLASTDCSLIRQGDLLYTRSVGGGALSLLAPATEGGARPPRESLSEMALGVDQPDPGRAAILGQFVARAGNELHRVAEFGRREYGCAPELVLVTGEGCLVDRLPEALGERMGVPGRRVDVSRLAVRCAAGVGTEQRLLKHLDCVGAALTPTAEGAIQVDLTPPAYLAKRQAQRLRQVALVTGALALITVVLTAVYLHLALVSIRQSADLYQEAIDELRPWVEDMVDKRTQIQIIQSFFNEQNSAIAILDFLSGLDYMPPLDHSGDNPAVRVAVNDFVYDRGEGKLEISGLARDYEDLSRLRADLLATGFFSYVPSPVRSPHPWSQGRPTVLNFTFDPCELVGQGLPDAGGGTAPAGQPARSTSEFLGGTP